MEHWFDSKINNYINEAKKLNKEAFKNLSNRMRSEKGLIIDSTNRNLRLLL